MAKVSMGSITPTKKMEVEKIQINGQEVEVVQYLPIADKMELVEKVLNATIDDTGFLNPMRMEIYTAIEIIRAYTNISITEKMMENPTKTYDLLEMNGIIDAVVGAMGENEYDTIFDAVEECAEHGIAYLNSFVGMMKTISADFDATKMNVDEVMKALDDPEKVGLVKDILDKIG